MEVRVVLDDGACIQGNTVIGDTVMVFHGPTADHDAPTVDFKSNQELVLHASTGMRALTTWLMLIRATEECNSIRIYYSHKGQPQASWMHMVPRYGLRATLVRDVLEEFGSTRTTRQRLALVSGALLLALPSTFLVSMFLISDIPIQSFVELLQHADASGRPGWYILIGLAPVLGPVLFSILAYYLIYRTPTPVVQGYQGWGGNSKFILVQNYSASKHEQH